MNKNYVAALVVTRNRSQLLLQCLKALSVQTILPDFFIIVDNASTDDTKIILKDFFISINIPFIYKINKKNIGGSGGFASGMELAFSHKASWIWMMDDDACPHSTALEELLKIAVNPQNIYGSLAVAGPHTAWATTLVDEGRMVNVADQVPSQARVEYIPFLGLIVHRDLVKKIGLPDEGFFIAADDVEYCMRAKRAGADMIIAGKSRIEHPRAQVITLNVLGRNIAYLRLPPWKRYYDTRNRILIAKKYYGIQLFTKTMPGTFIRFFVAIATEPFKLRQMWAFFAGVCDGLRGVKGDRHMKWGIRQ
jgi:GT2 family glycosyltransferase